MRKRKNLKRRTALFYAGMMSIFLLAGCGKEEPGLPDGKKEGVGVSDSENTEKSMGRYLEKEITVPEEIKTMSSYPIPCLQKLDEGGIVLAEQIAGRYISADAGENWEYADCPWQDVSRGAFISDIALSPDGAAAVVYSPFAEETESEEADTEGNLSEIKRRVLYFDRDGNRTELDFPETGDEEIWKLVFDRQERLYGYTPDGRAYQIDPVVGTKKELFVSEGIMDYVCFTDRYMIGFTTRGEAVIYDVENEKLLQEDRTLQDFVSENLGNSIGNSDRGHELVAAAGEQEDIIYFAFSGGLYRHVIGGAVIEQIIDGATSSFGDPSMMLVDMVMLPDNEFAVLYDDVRLCRYTYDPNVPSVPGKQLKVYSLEENYSMRQAVSLFQKMHQDVYVRYEIGMTGADGVTREDAVRNLNTKIMSGEGPDILLLDGLPQTSYEEKGILADVSGVVDSLSGEEELFPNVVEACRKDGKIYGLPIRIQIPMMAGSEEYVEKIKDIGTLADAVEEIRAENPEGAVLGLKSEEQLLYVLGMVSSEAWTDEKGNIDEKTLEEFLEAAGRIWQAEISGVDMEWLKDKRNYSSGFAGEGRHYASLSVNVISMALKEQKLAVGKIYRVDFDYDVLTSIAEISEDDFGYGFWNGQVSGGFIPDGLAGVCADSADDELAMEFYRFLFGRELQDMDLSGGMPVNMASFDTLEKNPREGAIGGDEELAGGLIVSNNDGDYYLDLDVKWPKEEEFRKLKEMVGSTVRISTGDTAIEQAVYEIGPDALNGVITPQEAVKKILKKSAIYLAE